MITIYIFYIHESKIVYSRLRNDIYDLLCNYKDKIHKDLRYGVYKIDCQTRGKTLFGISKSEDVNTNWSPLTINRICDISLNTL
jgi:hypothetical protein